MEENLRCPILQTLMRDPVVCSDGNTYERAAIEKWFVACKDTTPTSPLTGVELRSKVLIANHALRKTIQDYVQENPNLGEELTSEQDLNDFCASKDVYPPSAPLPLSCSSSTSSSSSKVEVKVVKVEPAANTSMLFVSTRDSNVHANAKCTVFKAKEQNFSQQQKVTLDFPTGVSAMALLDDNRETLALCAGFRSGHLSALSYDKSSQCLSNTKQTVQAHYEAVTCLSSPTHRSDILISGSEDNTLVVFKNLVSQYKIETHSNSVRCCDSKDNLLVSGADDWKVCLHDIEKNNRVRQYMGHNYAVNCVAFQGRPSDLLASGSDDEYVYVWDARSSRYVAKLPTGSQVLSCVWIPGDLGLAAAGGVSPNSFKGSAENVDGWVRLWDTRTWKVVTDCSQIVATGDQMASNSLNRPNSLEYFKHNRSETDSNKTRLAHYGAVTHCGAASLPDGSNLLCSAGTDSYIRTWKLLQGVSGISKVELHQTIPVRDICFCFSLATVIL